MNPRLQALRDEFYEWEQLGRGELVWDAVVSPEPYFVPFFGHGYFTDSTPPVDDGRSHTFISALLGGSAGSSEPQKIGTANHLIDPLRSRIAPSYVHDMRDDLVEALWTLPGNIAWNPGQLSQLLYALNLAQRPMCFEFLAYDGKIEIQWVVDRLDKQLLSDAIQRLPFHSTLTWRDHHLTNLIIARSPEEMSRIDLALEREFIFPTIGRPDHDPLTELFRALSYCDPSLLVAVQMVFEPCKNRWAQSLCNLVSSNDGKPFFADGEGFQKAARSKVQHPLFATCVRLVALGNDVESCDQGLRSVARSFAVFEGENGFVVADPYECTFEEALIHLVGRCSRRSGMLLNGEELLSLIHPPSEKIGAPALVRSLRKTWPVPAKHAHNFTHTLGTNNHASDSLACGLNPSERLRHMHVLGASGTGKSTFLLNSICEDLEKGGGLALLDPHGDLVEAVLDRIPAHRVSDIVIFDPADADWPVGFNILEAHSEAEKNLLASDFVAIFERLSSSWGDQMTAVLGNAAMAFLESDQGGTLLDLKRFLIEKGFRDRFLPSVKDPEIRYFWTHEFPLLRGTTQASLLTRLNGFLRHRMVRNIVSQKGEKFGVVRMMNEGKILLAPLSQGLIGQENSWLLGSLLVSRFYQAALSRQSTVEEERRPYTLYLDEAHSFLTPSIAAILSGARKYGLGLVLSHQEIGQFPARESGILGSILTNCHSRVYFRLGDQDAKRLESTFDHFEAEDFRRLGVGEAICRIGGSDGDFTISTAPAPEPAHDAQSNRARAIEHSRSTYARPREEVEQSRSDAGVEVGKAAPAEPREPSARITRKDTSEQAKPPKATPPPNPPVSSEPATKAEPATAPEEEEIEEKPKAKPERTPGRGGAQHLIIQNLIKQHGEGLGFRCGIDQQIEGGGFCDVLLYDSDLVISFEVALHSSIKQEVQNIRKTIGTNVQELVFIGEDRSHLETIQKTAEKELGAGTVEKIEFLTVQEMGGYFARLGARRASSQSTFRGYTVTTKFKPMDEDVRAHREADIHRAVAKRRKDGQGGADT